MKISQYRLLINGEMVAPTEELDVLNPATGEIVSKVPRATKEHVDASVAAAFKAFPGWAAQPWDERKSLLSKLIDRLESQRTEFAKVLVQEQGKPLAQAQGEVDATVMFARHMISLKFEPEIIEDDGKAYVEAFRKPLGVVAGIAPWNYPVLIGFLKLVPALLCGNTFILKPAPTTPITSLMIGELAKDVFPAGVVNVLVDKNDLGGYISTHPDIAKVSFTGSTATGKKVMASSAETLKRVTLELGGNDAALVLDDANVDEIAPKIFEAAFMNAGQVCIAIKRVYVPESLYDHMCECLATIARDATVGNGLDAGVTVGPIQNAMQFEKAKVFLHLAHDDGKVIAGGRALTGEGYFIQPTIVRDISDTSRLVEEEQFAPILPIISYGKLDDAISSINKSRMGLGGSVWSSNVSRAIETARRIESGTVWVNQHLNFGPNIPLGGAKESGIGADYALEGLSEYTQLSVVNARR